MSNPYRELPSDHPYSKLIRRDRWLLDQFSKFYNGQRDGGSGVEDFIIDEFMTKLPRSVVALILREDGWILAVSRRGRPNDLGLPGGKIDPGEIPSEAVMREVAEETGVLLRDPEFCYERVDNSDGAVAWCYRGEWSGTPRQMEDGIAVVWVKPERLLDASCTFREYNRGVLSALGLV